MILAITPSSSLYSSQAWITLQKKSSIDIDATGIPVKSAHKNSHAIITDGYRHYNEIRLVSAFLVYLT